MSASVTAGYFTSLSVPVTLANGSDTGSGVNAGSGIVERDEAPLDNGDGSCDAFPGSWATVTLSGGNDTSVVSGKCYRYRYKISDNVGNQGTSGASATAKVETSPPSDPTLSYGSFTNTALNGGVVYYRPGAASGQFQVTAAGSTDTQSGLASYSFPAAASGWSVSGAGASRTYSHTGAPTDPAEPNNVFATNGAGLNSGNVSFTVTPDSTGPSVTAPTVTAGYFTTTSVAVTLNGGTDGGSGVAAGSSLVERDEALLDNSDGTCDAFPGSWATVTLSGGNDTTVVSGKCYRYREQLSDNVGNQGSSSASNTAKVDTSAPSDPSLSYGSFTNAALNGGVVWYRPSAANGQFQVTANGSTDTQSGIASHAFPAAASGWSVSGSGNARTLQPHRQPVESWRAEQRARDERRRPQLQRRLFHGHARLDGPLGHGPQRRRELLHLALRPGRAQRRHRRRVGRQRRLERRRARRGAARQRRRHLRRLPGLLVDGHPLGRQRHQRGQRQVLPLPRAPLRQRRQPGPLGREATRPRWTRRPRAILHSRTGRSPTPRSTAASSGTAPRRPTASSR